MSVLEITSGRAQGYLLDVAAAVDALDGEGVVKLHPTHSVWPTVTDWIHETITGRS